MKHYEETYAMRLSRKAGRAEEVRRLRRVARELSAPPGGADEGPITTEKEGGKNESQKHFDGRSV